MYMKYLFIVLAFVTVIAMCAVFFNTKQESTPADNQTVTQNDNIASTTVTNPPEIPADIKAHIQSKSNMIVLESPAPYTTIDSPVTLKGKARGNWFFEASFPIVVVNWDGLIIGQGIATADGEWMTTEFVPFTATITYTEDPNVYSQNGALILKKDNPSGLSENDDALEIPIIFKK